MATPPSAPAPAGAPAAAPAPSSGPSPPAPPPVAFDPATAYQPPPLIGDAADETYQRELKANRAQALLSGGVELIVQGLERTTPQSAIRQLERILADLRGKGIQLPDVLVTPPIRDSAPVHSLDYAIISFRGDYKYRHHLDFMFKVMEVLRGANQNLDVQWNIAPGYDKKRTVWFRDDHNLGVLDLRRRLESIFASSHYDYQVCTTNTTFNPPRVTFHFLNSSCIENLVATPPIIKGHTIIPRLPRYIEPIYALEIRVVGIAIFEEPQLIIDSYLQEKYGRLASHALIRSSRLAFDDTVYCVVLETPELARCYRRCPKDYPFSYLIFPHPLSPLPCYAARSHRVIPLP